MKLLARICLSFACLCLVPLAAGVGAALAQTAAAVIPAAAPINWLDTVKSAAGVLVTPLAISGAVSALTAFLPQGQRGTIWGFVRKVLDAVAWNWGNAANEPKV